MQPGEENAAAAARKGSEDPVLILNLGSSPPHLRSIDRNRKITIPCQALYGTNRLPLFSRQLGAKCTGSRTL